MTKVKVFEMWVKLQGHWVKNYGMKGIATRIVKRKIVAAFRGMHVSPAKHSYASVTDGRTDKQTDGRTTDKVIPMCRYASQATQKGRDLTQSYDKSPYTDRKKSKKQRDNTKTPPKTSITQRLRTDLGRSVGVTIATQLVLLNRFTGSQPSN